MDPLSEHTHSCWKVYSSQMTSIKSDTHTHDKHEARIIGFFFVGAAVALHLTRLGLRVLYSKIRKSPHWSLPVEELNRVFHWSR
jgi:hypothetical protein